MVFAAAHQPPAQTPKVEDFFCSTPGTLAKTSWKHGRIIFCPPSFSKISTVGGEASNIQRGSAIDAFYSGSRIFVHELVHLWKQSKMLIAVSKRNGY